MGTVNKSDMIREVAEATGHTAAAAQAAVDAFLAAVKTRAEAGDTISLRGFGIFKVRARPARMGRNIRTGEPMELPESRKLTFKAAKTKA
ncbi:DNA-binding protein HBsu [Rhodovulum sp. P5]|uniref:HU family DNA-binding protein n=1 Tax=Rhodovulum sp. P5 TaxID=1564506 RepID=UPI0009C3858D|nr:HU family DNA-binding protein [Rhodovulum sp. P5]ARE40885.1 DNA-binding protein HBsu [Rhodovulum sp. P5]